MQFPVDKHKLLETHTAFYILIGGWLHLLLFSRLLAFSANNSVNG